MNEIDAEHRYGKSRSGSVTELLLGGLGVLFLVAAVILALPDTRDSLTRVGLAASGVFLGAWCFAGMKIVGYLRRAENRALREPESDV